MEMFPTRACYSGTSLRSAVETRTALLLRGLFLNTGKYCGLWTGYNRGSCWERSSRPRLFLRCWGRWHGCTVLLSATLPLPARTPCRTQPWASAQSSELPPRSFTRCTCTGETWSQRLPLSKQLSFYALASNISITLISR